MSKFNRKQLHASPFLIGPTSETLTQADLEMILLLKNPEISGSSAQLRDRFFVKYVDYKPGRIVIYTKQFNSALYVVQSFYITISVTSPSIEMIDYILQRVSCAYLVFFVTLALWTAMS